MPGIEQLVLEFFHTTPCGIGGSAPWANVVAIDGFGGSFGADCPLPAGSFAGIRETFYRLPHSVVPDASGALCSRRLNGRSAAIAVWVSSTLRRDFARS